MAKNLRTRRTRSVAAPDVAPPEPWTLLTELRQERNLTLQGVAERVGSSAGYMKDLEAGRRNPSLNMLHKLADALHVEFWLLRDSKPGTGRSPGSGRRRPPVAA